MGMSMSVSHACWKCSQCDSGRMCTVLTILLCTLKDKLEVCTENEVQFEFPPSQDIAEFTIDEILFKAMKDM